MKVLFRLLTALAFLTGTLTVTSCAILEEMRAMKEPRYEVGEQKGARYCGECHQEIYDQWASNSRHALANTSDSFHDIRGKFKNNLMLNLTMGESMCYACHGSKAVNEGVNCETCHGTVNPETSIEETHRKKYRPGLADLRRADFCAKCHEMKNPMSGSLIMSVFSEWQQSPSAANGITCQACHMKSRENGLRYHGFDTARRNVAIYRDDVTIKDVQLQFPQLRMAIENRVTGHAIPASCGTRLLVLEINCLDEKDREAHRIVQSFTKTNELMGGIMPYRVLENTQLQSGEIRPLTFTLPSSLQNQIHKAILTLRFYEVPDEHQGDLNKANWISEPFLRKEVSFRSNPTSK